MARSDSCFVRGVQFKKITADLQFTVHRLEAEFSGALSSTSSAGCVLLSPWCTFASQERCCFGCSGPRSDSTNPLKLHRRITQLQTSIQTLQQRATETSTRKQVWLVWLCVCAIFCCVDSLRARRNLLLSCKRIVLKFKPIYQKSVGKLCLVSVRSPSYCSHRLNA